MGYVYADYITRGAEVVLSVIADTERVAYSYFYDGTEERCSSLARELGTEDDMVSAELVIDLAVGQLSDAGWVVTNELTTKLADDEFDYEIVLTRKGKTALTSGLKFKGHDVEV